MVGVSGGIYIAVVNTMTTGKLEVKVPVAHTPTSLFNINGSPSRNSDRAGIWRLRLMQRPWRSAAYWLSQPDFVVIIIISRQVFSHIRAGVGEPVQL